MAKKTKWFRKVCRCCGDPFETDRSNIRYCSECAQTQTEETGKNRIEANKGIYSDLRKLKKYNDKHGTNLSYGKYKLALFLGKVKI